MKQLFKCNNHIITCLNRLLIVVLSYTSTKQGVWTYNFTERCNRGSIVRWMTCVLPIIPICALRSFCPNLDRNTNVQSVIMLLMHWYILILMTNTWWIIRSRWWILGDLECDVNWADELCRDWIWDDEWMWTEYKWWFNLMFDVQEEERQLI